MNSEKTRLGKKLFSKKDGDRGDRNGDGRDDQALVQYKKGGVAGKIDGHDKILDITNQVSKNKKTKLQVDSAIPSDAAQHGCPDGQVARYNNKEPRKI